MRWIIVTLLMDFYFNFQNKNTKKGYIGIFYIEIIENSSFLQNASVVLILLSFLPLHVHYNFPNENAE